MRFCYGCVWLLAVARLSSDSQIPNQHSCPIGRERVTWEGSICVRAPTVSLHPALTQACFRHGREKKREAIRVTTEMNESESDQNVTADIYYREIHSEINSPWPLRQQTTTPRMSLSPEKSWKTLPLHTGLKCGNILASLYIMRVRALDGS